MGMGLLLPSGAEKDAHPKEKGVFGDLSSLSDCSELSQSHNRCRRWSKRLDFEVIEHRSRKLLPSNQFLQSYLHTKFMHVLVTEQVQEHQR
jgi:hypothetical protein